MLNLSLFSSFSDSDSDTYISPGLQKSSAGILIKAAFLNKNKKIKSEDGDGERNHTEKERKKNDKGEKEVQK